MIVQLTGEFVHIAGRKEVEIYGPTTIKALLAALEMAYPTGKWQYCCVAINGTMYQDDWLKSINENDDEVVIMPAIGGG